MCFPFQVCRPPRTYPVLRFTILQLEFPPRITLHLDLSIIAFYLKLLGAVEFYLYLKFDQKKNIYHFSIFSANVLWHSTNTKGTFRAYANPALDTGVRWATRTGTTFVLFQKASRVAKFIIPCSYRLHINDVESSLTKALRRSRD